MAWAIGGMLATTQATQLQLQGYSRASCDTSGHVDQPDGGSCHLSPTPGEQPQ